MMWAMERRLDAFQTQVQQGTMHIEEFGTQMIQEGLNLPPMDIRTDRIAENIFQQTVAFVTHG